MLHQIGIGALGPVFRTYEPTRDRLVAVKVFRLDIVPEQAQALATALGRAASASLFHPSIVEPIAAGVEGTLAYRAEEYVAAESLDVAMRHYAPAPIDKVLPFITQLAGAIDFARAAGVGHGALHPRDIFVTPDDARATGFGVIEALEEVGIRAPVRRPYTAPERIEGRPWSTPADIFSLAAITFELLTGRRPAGTGALIGSLPEGEHSAALQAVLARGMHEDPSQRYSSALAFAAALESAGRGQIEAAPMPQVAPVAPPAPVVAAPTPGEFAVERELEPAPATAAEHTEPIATKYTEPIATQYTEPIATEYTEHTDAVSAEPPEPPEPAEPPEPPEPPKPAAPLLFDTARDERAPERFADEFVPEEPAHEESQPLAPPEPLEPAAEAVMYDAPEPSRPAVLPTAIGVVLGLLAGFAGGYFVGSRDRLAPETQTATASPAGPATRDQPGQYSEQKVSPAPASPPPPAVAATGSKPTEPKPGEVPPVVQETEPSRAGTPPKAPPAAPRNERAKTNGTIVVKSSPSHAGVTVNGKWRGRTPLTLDRLAFGRYVVRIVQPGYKVAQEEFQLAARDADHTFSAKLERTTTAAKREPASPKGEGRTAPAGGFVGTLYIDSRPRGATVILDGRNIGVTPLSVGDVRIGTHVVRVELAGKKPWASTTNVTAGQMTRVTMSLEDK